jgi:hypothetical protein
MDPLEILDRVLDKGIVIDAWMLVSLGGIELVTVDARVVVASLETYLTRSSAVAEVPHVAAPLTGPIDDRPRTLRTGPVNA